MGRGMGVGSFQTFSPWLCYLVEGPGLLGRGDDLARRQDEAVQPSVPQLDTGHNTRKAIGRVKTLQIMVV